jgi:outer membrane protein assembly factor BamB
VITEYVLPGETVFPEGITEDPDGSGFYVSSSRHGTIFRGRTDAAQAQMWLPGGVDGRDQALGMTVDNRGRLFVCGGSTGRFFAYDTVSGESLGSRTVPGEPHLLNDVCIAGDYAYVTDSERPVVWRFDITDGLGEPEEWLDITQFGAHKDALHYLNGILAAGRGDVLIAAAQGTGVLWRLDVASASAVPVDLDGELVNGDGMVFAGDLLYVCDNSDDPDGTVHMWLTALRLADDARSAEVAGRWERPLHDTPTTCAYLDGRLYLVNSQFAAERSGAAAPPFTVTALPPPA